MSAKAESRIRDLSDGRAGVVRTHGSIPLRPVLARVRLAAAIVVAPLLAPLAYLGGQLFLSGYIYDARGKIDPGHWGKMVEGLPVLYLSAMAFCLVAIGAAALLRRLGVTTVILIGLAVSAFLGLLLAFVLKLPAVAENVLVLGIATGCGVLQALVLCLLAGLSWRRPRLP